MSGAEIIPDDVLHEGPDWTTPPALIGEHRVLHGAPRRGNFPPLDIDPDDAWSDE